MATISNLDTIYEEYRRIVEKIDFLQGELFDNLEVSEFKNYVLNEMAKLKLQIIDYQQSFLEEYGKEIEGDKKPGLSL